MVMLNSGKKYLKEYNLLSNLDYPAQKYHNTHFLKIKKSLFEHLQLIKQLK